MTEQPSTTGPERAPWRDRRDPARGERGATLVEYALIVAIVAVGLIGATDLLGAAAEAKFESAGEGISVSDGSTPTTAPTPTTTPTPTTAPTTVPGGGGGGTTTTTSTVPEADPVPTRSYSTWGPGSTQQKGNTWSAQVPIVITDDLGQRVEGATVTVRVEYRDSTGWHTSTTQVKTTGANGALTFSSDDLARTGKDPVTEIRFTVTSVESEGLQHRPTTPSTTVKKP